MITEFDLADGFVEKHKDDLHYNWHYRKWFIRTEEGWQRDTTLAAADLARQFVLEAASTDMTESERIWLCSHTSVRNLLWLAGTYKEMGMPEQGTGERGLPEKHNRHNP